MMRLRHRVGAALRRDEGNAIVETAFASVVFLSLFIGAFQMLQVLYTYNFVAEAAREGSRYAMVRGSTSCTNTPSLTNCGATGTEIQTWVRSHAYPGVKSASLSVTSSWLTASSTTPTSWSACTKGTCNAPGNLVQVVTAYSYPVSVPFTPSFTFNLTSTSKVVIAQ